MIDLTGETSPPHSNARSFWPQTPLAPRVPVRGAVSATMWSVNRVLTVWLVAVWLPACDDEVVSARDALDWMEVYTNESDRTRNLGKLNRMAAMGPVLPRFLPRLRSHPL